MADAAGEHRGGGGHPKGGAEGGGGPLGPLRAACDLSWVADLEADPETGKYAPNRSSRQVRSGHYVVVPPTALPDPKLVIFSEDMAARLGLTPEQCLAPEFAAYFSGDVPAPPPGDLGKRTAWGTTWATPYALSICGREFYDNCPFKNGNGYGDGRAISVAEVLRPDGERWEMQLKGAGPTPFCRGADGRAVLRSSVREFLASEAMHHLGVSTTRALSLVVSETLTTDRPWYSNRTHGMSDEELMSDPRVQGVPPPFLPVFLQMLRERSHDPDQMQTESCAITCRVAPSFVRVGHIELFGRRVARTGGEAGSPERDQLEQIVRHAIARDYPACAGGEGTSLSDQVLSLLEAAAGRITTLTAEWIRVGYCQGNFNSDNCLVAGRSLDYGPFGFVEKFTPLWRMWVGANKDYGFMRQPLAGVMNLGSLASALEHLVEPEQRGRVAEIVAEAKFGRSKAAVNNVWARKLGFGEACGADDSHSSAAIVGELANRFLRLLEAAQADYTMAWRQLAGSLGGGLDPEASAASLLAPFRDATYAPLGDDAAATLEGWLRDWRAALHAAGVAAEDATALMRRSSPKYVPREWMLVDAYGAADAGDYSLVHELHELFKRPYDEQPELEAKYYKKTPLSTYHGAGRGGTAFMS